MSALGERRGGGAEELEMQDDKPHWEGLRSSRYLTRGGNGLMMHD